MSDWDTKKKKKSKINELELNILILTVWKVMLSENKLQNMQL